jgi:hypothetical protein
MARYYQGRDNAKERKDMPKDTYGWGIVGCGVIAPNHAKAVMANGERAQLIGVCDVVPEKAEKLAGSSAPNWPPPVGRC